MSVKRFVQYLAFSAYIFEVYPLETIFLAVTNRINVRRAYQKITILKMYVFLKRFFTSVNILAVGQQIFLVKELSLFSIPGGRRKDPMKEGLFVLPFQRFLGMVSLVFSKFWHGARNPSEVVRGNAGFFQKKKKGKSTKNGPKTGFFEFKENFCHLFLLNLFYNENLYYLLCFCTNPIFGKILVSEIWPKVFSASQIEGFFNQPYLRNKLM